MIVGERRHRDDRIEITECLLDQVGELASLRTLLCDHHPVVDVDDVESPDVVVVEAERPAPAVGVLADHGENAAQHQERDQQLDQDETVGAAPVPDQLEGVADHRTPPRNASTG